MYTQSVHSFIVIILEKKTTKKKTVHSFILLARLIQMLMQISFFIWNHNKSGQFRLKQHAKTTTRVVSSKWWLIMRSTKTGRFGRLIKYWCNRNDKTCYFCSDRSNFVNRNHACMWHLADVTCFPAPPVRNTKFNPEMVLLLSLTVSPACELFWRFMGIRWTQRHLGFPELD